MDRISQMSDELLLKILSLLPTVNEVVATMILSKRWQFLWKMVPKLVYDDKYQNIEFARFSRFVDRSLFLHEAPVIETLHFKLGESCGPDDIQVWIRAADKCCLRELILESNISSRTSSWFILPRSFYTGCRMLVTLNLSYAILADVSSPISFPSLKNLSLLSVKYPGDEFFNRLLSNCPVLEDLVLKKCHNDNVSIFTIRVPSLTSLFVCKKYGREGAHGFVIDTPSLVMLKIIDWTDGFCIIENEMPMIVTVDVDIPSSNLGKILSSVTSVKDLNLCLTAPEYPYPVGKVFHQLLSLTVCRCGRQWLNLLMRVLGNCPKLQALTLDQYHGTQAHDPSPCWTKPSSVPNCLISSLEILNWEDYEGAEEEKKVVDYILRNGACLKKVTISSKSTDNDKKLEMLKVLSMSFRRSPTCQLEFN